ncbi:MAG: 16S rRNA (uracil1498-N3)-methyltransferase [Bacteroidia bacterium]|jgi:16S rRNA (uracil1498-N3)-methyltransferase
MHHFFSQEISDNKIVLSEEESRHCIKVMRLNIGDEIRVFNGQGQTYMCSIQTKGKYVEAQVIEVLQTEDAPKLKLTLAVSPTKSADRMEWMVEKLVEIGVFRLVFIRTEKGERSRINEKRLVKKAVSALKQSGNLWLPIIETNVNFKDFIENESSETKFIAHCFDKDKAQINRAMLSKSACILIGPEGDFSVTEVDLATKAGFQPLSLGLPRYRTETAAIVSSTLINHFNVTLA